eukprot:maker-scaffold506_size152672-snap-gene-0.20 protein:Tk07579 transcript:maker-scaffold506_size152672-snap-gene-0.20-mRNA-1 annotation:"---NA---"
MKWMYAVAAFALFAVAQAEFETEEEAGDPRLGFITVDGAGVTSVTFNATSIQNAVILGLFILVLGALIIPLLGFLGGKEEETSGYGSSGYEQTGYQTGYEQPSSGYNTYSKRVEAHEDGSALTEGRDGTLTLSGNSQNSFLLNLVYIIPIVLGIILLDFAIFGTVATRSDNLNPVSHFFYKAKEGLHIVMNRNRYRPRAPAGYNRVSAAAPAPTRSIHMVAPVIEALSAAYRKYEDDEQ